MRSIAVSANEWLYPDIMSYASQTQDLHLRAPRGGYAAAQVFIPDTRPGKAIRVTYRGDAALGQPECYRLIDVRVERNTNNDAEEPGCVTPEGSAAPPFVTRQAPFRVYDALRPFDQGGDVTEKNATALYLAWKIPRDAAPGTYRGSVEIAVGDQSVALDATVVIHKAALPEKSRLFITNWYNVHNIGEPYGLERGSGAWYDMFAKFMALMRRTRQTHILINLNCIKITPEGSGYRFDFTEIERMIRMAIAAGFEGLEMGHICVRNYVHTEKYWLFYRPDGRKIYADSPEGYRFLALFLPQWKAFLEKNGWYEGALHHVGDEPTVEMGADYRVICGMVRKFMPGVKLFDAICHEELAGAVDTWVPLSSTYQRHRERYEEFRELGDDIWDYTCCGPRGFYLNRFLDYALIKPRLLHWGNYLYNLKGYLHWGFNYWQLGGYQKDVYENSCGVSDDGTFWPAGDTHICYPGNENGPWPSMRAERMRAGAEDCELLYLLADRDRAAADAACARVVRSFDDYDTDPVRFEESYKKLLEQVDAL